MATYDVAVGIDQQALNGLSERIYDAVHPTFFSGSETVGKFNIDRVEWDITRAPTFDLSPSARASAALLDDLNRMIASATTTPEAIAAAQPDDNDFIQALCDFAETTLAFELMIPALTVTLVPSGGGTIPPVTGSVAVFCRANIESDNRLVVRIIRAEAMLDGDETLQAILNEIVLPEVESQVNDQLLKGIPLPPLTYDGLTLSAPVIAIQDRTLLAFAALSSRGATQAPAAGTNWPRNRTFILFDSDVIDQLATRVLAGTRKSGKTSFSFKKGIFKFSASASYQAGVKDPQVRLGSGDAFQVRVDAFGGGSVQVKAFGHGPTLGLTLSAIPDVNASVDVTSGNDVRVVFNAVNDFRVKIDLKDVPSFLNSILSKLLSGLTGPIARLIGSLLKGLNFSVFQIPDFPIDRDGLSVTVRLEAIDVTTIKDVDGMPLVAVDGTVDVQKETQLLEAPAVGGDGAMVAEGQLA